MSEFSPFLETKRFAVVTGANKGIGLEICRQLASHGVTVILTARDPTRGFEALQSLTTSNSGLSDLLLFHQLDVTDPESVASLADFVKSQFGRLDILVNNAAINGVDVDIDAVQARIAAGKWSATRHNAKMKICKWNFSNLLVQQLEKFEFSAPEARKDAVIKKINERFKDHRSKLKQAHFDTKTTYAERIKAKPKSKLACDWKYLVNLWSTPDFDAMSTRNKANRAKVQMSHYSSTKSHARLKEEFARKRKTKNGEAQEIGPANAEAIAKLEELKKQRVEGQHVMNDDEMFAKVLGPEKHGYLRAYGPGKTILDYFGSKSNCVSLIKQIEEVKEKSRDEMNEFKKTLEERVKLVEEREKMQEERIEQLMQQLQRSQRVSEPQTSFARDDDCGISQRGREKMLEERIEELMQQIQRSQHVYGP